MDGRIDAEGRETEIMEDLKWGFYRMFRNILQAHRIPRVPKFKCTFVAFEKCGYKINLLKEKFIILYN
jgi:hypothetical protein